MIIMKILKSVTTLDPVLVWLTQRSKKSDYVKFTFDSITMKIPNSMTTSNSLLIWSLHIPKSITTLNILLVQSSETFNYKINPEIINFLQSVYYILKFITTRTFSLKQTNTQTLSTENHVTLNSPLHQKIRRSKIKLLSCTIITKTNFLSLF